MCREVSSHKTHANLPLRCIHIKRLHLPLFHLILPAHKANITVYNGSHFWRCIANADAQFEWTLVDYLAHAKIQKQRFQANLS